MGFQQDQRTMRNASRPASHALAALGAAANAASGASSSNSLERRSEPTAIAATDLKLPPPIGRPAASPGSPNGAAPEQQPDIKADTVKGSQMTAAAVVAAILPMGLSNPSARQGMNDLFKKVVLPEVNRAQARTETKVDFTAMVRISDEAMVPIRNNLAVNRLSTPQSALAARTAPTRPS